MATKWIHKEDVWQAASSHEHHEYDGHRTHRSWNGSGWKIEDGVPKYGRVNEEQFKNAQLSFPDWLNLLCSDGWEVLKISRDFNNANQATWVVFRKQV
ncbi:MAG: hypothetical protein HOE69_01855 [Euryarchaeota archaeon]|jgi:hypothetical protein|nr:hypothetical protein [Euryarchaeota archaeon]